MRSKFRQFFFLQGIVNLDLVVILQIYKFYYKIAKLTYSISFLNFQVAQGARREHTWDLFF